MGITFQTRCADKNITFILIVLCTRHYLRIYIEWLDSPFMRYGGRSLLSGIAEAIRISLFQNLPQNFSFHKHCHVTPCQTRYGNLSFTRLLNCLNNASHIIFFVCVNYVYKIHIIELVYALKTRNWVIQLLFVPISVAHEKKLFWMWRAWV